MAPATAGLTEPTLKDMDMRALSGIELAHRIGKRQFSFGRLETVACCE
jgi:hypothetical protein